MVSLKQDNKYYSLHQESHEKRSAWSYLLWPMLLPRWIFSYPLARAVTNVTLNPTKVKKQDSVHYVSLSDDSTSDSAVIIDLLPHKPNKLFYDFLLSTPFASTVKKRKLTYLNDDDKKYIEKMLAEVDKLIQGQSSAGKTFNLSNIYFKGIEYLDESLRAYFFEKLQEKSSEQPLNLRNLQFDFFSLETTDAVVLDSVAVTCSNEENKPMSERKFVISCLPGNQNYINRLQDFRHLAQQIDCTVIGFNYRGICDSSGVIWTQDNAVDDVLSQVQRLLMMGANPKNICLEGHGIGGAITTLAAAQLHEQGQEVKVLGEESPFRSLSQYIVSYIFPSPQSNLWYPVNWLRYFIGALVYLLVLPLLWIIGWQMDVERAWNKIPPSSKDCRRNHDHSDPEAQITLDNKPKSVIVDRINSLFEQTSTSSFPNSATSAAEITQQPFLIASSGGAGHISAMMGLIDDMRLKNPEIEIPLHQAQLDQDKQKSNLGFFIRAGVYVMSIRYIGYVIKYIAKAVGYFAMPNWDDFWQEYNKLNQTESAKNMEAKVEGRHRPYVDLIIDTYPDGYEAIALFNSLQRSGNMEDLCRVASNQDYSDQLHYKHVYDYVLTELNNALETKKPYTEIKSTQIGSIDAICDAVDKYNSDLLQANQKFNTVFPPIEIHQYFTEFSVPEATHFLKPVLKLTPKQRELVHIHAVNLTPAVQFAYLDDGLGFKGIHPIEFDKNPMVRAGFKEESLSNYLDKEKACSLEIKAYSYSSLNYWMDSGKETIQIQANEKVASIMLSSQATTVSVDYVKSLLDVGYDKIFVFGGLNQNIYDPISKLIQDSPENERKKIEQRIIRLGNQTDKEMGPIMTRSDCVVIRSGGLSVMEQAALPLPKDKSKKFFIHQPSNETSISWEDGNANCFIRHMHTKGFFASKASPETVREKLSYDLTNACGL